MEEQEYIDTPTLAKLAGVSTNAIQIDIKRGVLPAEKRPDKRNVRWGGCWFIRADDAQKYIDTRKEKPQGISALELVRRTGKDHHTILEAIRSGELSASRLANKARIAWHIREEDARAYSERMGWEYVVSEAQSDSAAKGQSNGHKQVAASTAPILGTPDLCGSCGTEKGNILGDIDKTTHKKYGYLCARCHRLVQDFHGDITRMRKVLAYIEKTRPSHV